MLFTSWNGQNTGDSWIISYFPAGWKIRDRSVGSLAESGVESKVRISSWERNSRRRAERKYNGKVKKPPVKNLESKEHYKHRKMSR